MDQDTLTETENKFRRKIKSYVLRAGRMTEGQNRGWQLGWRDFGLEISNMPLNLFHVFSNSAPVVVEIGFGMGQSFLTMANAEPNFNFVGIEVHKPGVGAVLNELVKAQNNGHTLDNVKIFCHDAVTVFQQQIPDASLDRVQIFFPDPWHKKRHHKRRLIQNSFISLLSPKVKKGGRIHMATDWQPYAKHMLAILSQAKEWRNTSENNTYVIKPDYRPETKFEKRGIKLGHGVWDLIFQRI